MDLLGNMTLPVGEDPQFVTLDVTTPSVARMYNWYLGGTDNFQVDAELAARVAREFPSVIPGLRANRACLARMVRYLVDQEGIRQIIDLGSGLPSQGNVHEVARETSPDVKVAYVDNDVTVLGHARAILAKQGIQDVIVIRGDIRAPHSIIENPALRELIDFEEPVAVLAVAVLHFVTDEDDPKAIMSVFRDACAKGSYLALTTATTDGTTDEQRAEIQKLYGQASAPAVFRSRDQIAGLFEGYSLQEPGLVRIPDWRPDTAGQAKQRDGAEWFYCGVGKKL